MMHMMCVVIGIFVYVAIMLITFRYAAVRCLDFNLINNDKQHSIGKEIKVNSFKDFELFIDLVPKEMKLSSLFDAAFITIFWPLYWLYYFSKNFLRIATKTFKFIAYSFVKVALFSAKKKAIVLKEAKDYRSLPERGIENE